MPDKKKRGEFSIVSEQWLTLLDQLNISAFIIDMNRKITAFNHSLRALTGLRDLDVIGMDCRNVFKGAPCRVKCPFQKGWNPERDVHEIEIIDSFNEARLVTRIAAPLYNSQKVVAGCLTILQDYSLLTDLVKKVNYDERSLKIILDNLDIGIFTVNRGGHITFFNSTAEKITGYERSHVLGKPGCVVFSEDNEPDLGALKESMEDGRPRANRKMNIRTRVGEIVPISANYIPLLNEIGKIIGGLATIQDLTLAQQFDQVVSEKYSFLNMIGKDPSMQRIFDMVKVVAPTASTVLIEGATGTGKDLLAKVIHSAGDRHDKPFVKVNCAAIPDNLLESELFGYVKGAFSGADRDKPGRFQEADQGTIFLDEIGDLPLPLQAKLLRVLDDKDFYPLGGRHTHKVDVRVISATNRGLEKLVERKQFREDLFYRLNVMRIELPSLKERRSDLPLLIKHIVRKLCAARKMHPVDISEKAMEALLNYDYPGNVRELENILEHGLIVCRNGEIQPQHLQTFIRRRIERERSQMKTDGVADHRGRETLLWMLQQHNWHREKTARALGIDRTTLWRKMKKYGLLHN